MARFVPDQQPEVFFSTEELRATISYHARAGRLRRLGTRLYTPNLSTPEEVIVRRNAWTLVAGYFPGAVIADRTAMEFAPAADGSLFVASARARDVRLPGLRIRARAGEGPLAGDAEWMGENLFMSSRPRAFLENVRTSRARGRSVARTLNRRELEEALDNYARNDPAELGRLREAARALAPALGAEDELAILDELIGALQGTRKAKLVSTPGRARGRGLAYDSRRLERFETLQKHLLAQVGPTVAEPVSVNVSVFAFFEAYFSNFIEGTEFELEEAERLVFQGEIPPQRPKDAHEILGTYRLVSEASQRRRVPSSADELVEILKAQHRMMLSQRPEASPGEFKAAPNRAGGTQFVAPALVEGTLHQGWRFYSSLPAGFQRALFALFLVSEVHPFVDGNGRVARVLMNGELTSAREQRVIVTTYDRQDYLAALRAMTHNQRADTLSRTIAALQRKTAGVDFADLRGAESELRARDAFTDRTELEQGGLAAELEAAGEE